MNDIIVFTGLLLLCIGQGVERYLYQKDMTNKLNDAIKAVLARNINEYIAATTVPKTTNKPVEQDEIDFNADNPEEFDKVIKNIVK